MKLSLRSKLLLLILPLLGILAFLFFTALLPYQRVKTEINDLRPDVSKTVALGDLGIVLSRQMAEYYKLIASGGAEDRFQEARNNTQQSLERLRKEMAMHTGSAQDAEANHAVEEIAGQYAELNRLCQTGLELAKSSQRDKALNLIKTKIEPLLEDSLRIKFEQLDLKNRIEFEGDLARLRGHSDDLITFSRGDLQSNITNMKGHITDALLVFALARHFNRQMEEYHFFILAQSDGVAEIEAARRTTLQALESWKISEGGGLGRRATANKDLEAVENVERELIKLNQLADPVPDLARRGETAQALHLLADKIEPIAHGQLAGILDESVRNEGKALAASLDNVNKSSSQMQFGLGVFSLLVLVIGLGTPWLFSKTIISPILELKRAASKVGSGDLDAKVSVTSKGELSQLATTFNQMTEALKESRDSLHEANRELEQKVSDRTVELKDSNEQLQIELVERKLAEAALRESEKKYRAIFENAGQGIFQTTPEGQYISANPALARMHGFATPEEFIGGRQDITREVYVDAARREEFKKLIDEHRLVRGFEHQIFRRDGSKIWVSVNARAVRDERGTILYYEGTAQDITEHKQAEEKVQSLARFPSENPNPVLRLGRDGMILHANSASRLLLQDWGCAAGDRAPLFWQQEASEALASQTNKTIDVVCGDITLSIFVAPIVEADYVNLYGRDITERKQAEEALRQAERKYRDIFENAGEGISQSTPDGRFIAANPALARMYGFASPEELIHSRQDISRQLYVDPTRREEFKRQLEQQGAVRGFEYQGFRKDGSKIWVSVNARAVRDPRGAILYYEGTTQDINERKRAEAKSAAFATLARKLNGARTQLDAGRIIAQTAGDLFGWDSCDLNHYDADRDLVYQMLNIDTINGQQTEVFGVVSGRKPTARGRRVIDHGPELLLREEPVQFDADAIPFGDKTRPSASIMTVPVRHAARVTGLLSIQSYTPHNYDGAALADLQALADHCGAALNRIRAEQSLYESEERFRQMADHFEDVIWITDKDTSKVLYINPAYERVFGRSCESLYERRESFVEAVHPDDRDAVQRTLERQREGTRKPFEYRIVQPDGSVRWILRRSFPIRNNDGEIFRMAGIAQDITERKRAENGLRESEERFRQLSEAPFEAIILHDQGTILEVNQSFCRMYGYERAEVIGKSVLDLTLPEFREPLLQRVRSGASGSFGGLALRKDGTIFTAELAAKPIHYQGRAVRVAAIRDITEQKRNERRQAAQYAVTRVLAESATLAEATPHLLQVICESLRWKMGECWRVCDSTNLLRWVETWHVPALDATSFIEAARQTELAPGVGLPGRVWQSGQPAWIPDVMTDRRFARAAISAKVGLRGAVAFPILLGNHTLGVMQFFSRRTPEVDEDLLKMMSAIGSQIGQFTERKRAEEALRESEERYRDLIENSREFICTHNLDGLILSANRAAAEALGYDSNELLDGKNIRDILVPEVRHEFEQYMASLRQRDATSGVMLVETSTGERRMWEYYNSLRTEGVATPIVRGMARDITEQMRAEKAMSDLRRELELTMNSMEEGVHRVNLQGNIVFENPAAARMLGWEVSELLGKCGHLTMHHTRPDGTPYPKEECPIYATSCDGVSRHVADEVFWRQDGTSFPVEYMTAPMRNDRNEIVAAVVTFRDITERKRAEEEKKISFHQLGERVKELGALHRAAQIFQDTQKTTSDLLEEVASILPAAWQYPDICAARVTYDGAESTTPNYSDTLWKQSAAFATKDGKQGAIEVVYLEGRPNEVEGPFLAEERNLINTLAYDLTVFLERKHAEKALSESEERYRELFENAKDAIYVHDLSGRYTSVNSAAERLTGFTREEILGKHYSNFVAPRDLKHVRTNLCRKLDEENETIYEVDMVTRNGQRVPVEVSSRLIYEKGVAVGVQGTARDITDRKRAQEALRTYSQRLIQAQEVEREKIARELHDEIGQVLTAVRINLQSIQRSCRTGDGVPSLDESIGIVDEALERVRELSIELRPSLLDDLGLGAALRWYVDRYAQRTGIIAELLNGFKEDGRLPRELETACFRIAQEALTNVARHAQAVSVSVQLEHYRERMLLTIMDDGVGFETDDLRKNASAASALGLRGMEERALAVGGYIEIDSGSGRGTRVRATFPLRLK